MSSRVESCCTIRHLQNLRDTKQLQFSQNGKTIKYHIDDLEAYLNRGMVKARIAKP